MNQLNMLPASSLRMSTRIVIATLALGLSGCAQMQQQMQQPGYYNVPSASSATDAISQAEAAYATQGLRAPNQIQFDLRQPQSNVNRAAPTGTTAAAPTTYVAPANTSGQSATGSNAQVKPYDAAGAPIDTPPVNLGNQQGSFSATEPAASSTDSLRASLIPEAQTFFGTLPCFHPEMKCTAQKITLTLAPNGRWRARASYLEQNSQNGADQADLGCWRATPMNPPRVVLLNAQGGIRAELAMPTTGNAMRLISINGDSPNLTYTLTRQPDLDPIDELNKVAAPNCL